MSELPGALTVGEDSARRLNFIRRARMLGLSLAEIREISRLADSGRAPCCRDC